MSCQQPAETADASSLLEIDKALERACIARPHSATLIARNADPRPVFCIKAPCKVTATAVRDASFRYRLYPSLFWPCPAAARINSFAARTLRVELSSRPSTLARNVHLKTSTLVPVPILTMSMCEARLVWPREKCERQRS